MSNLKESKSVKGLMFNGKKYEDCIYMNSIGKLSFKDRISALFSVNFRIESEIYTEHIPGRTEAKVVFATKNVWDWFTDLFRKKHRGSMAPSEPGLNIDYLKKEASKFEEIMGVKSCMTCKNLVREKGYETHDYKKDEYNDHVYCEDGEFDCVEINTDFSKPNNCQFYKTA